MVKVKTITKTISKPRSRQRTLIRVNNRPFMSTIPTSNLRALKQANFNSKTARKKGRKRAKNFPLMSSRERSKHILPFLSCRLNPWMSNSVGMAGGPPDGSGGKRVLVDHRFISTFQFGTTGILNITALPIFPTCLYAWAPNSDTSFLINGNHPSAAATSNIPLFPAGVLPEWVGITYNAYNTAGQFDQYQPYLQATKARLVTYGVRIIYTGSTMTNSGYIVANRQSVSAPQGATSNPVSFTIAGNNGANTVFSSNQVLLSPGNFGSNYNQVANDSFGGRLEFGSYSVLKHNTSTYDWVDVRSNLMFITGGTNSTDAMFMGDDFATPATLAYTSAVSFFDDNWVPISYTINGGQTGQTFNVECIVCIEYEISNTSQIYQIASAPRPENSKEILVTNQAALKLPTASTNTNPLTQLIDTGLAAYGAIKPLVNMASYAMSLVP
jgi:hypothetical protein